MEFRKEYQCPNTISDNSIASLGGFPFGRVNELRREIAIPLWIIWPIHTKTLIPALERGYPARFGTLKGGKHLIKTLNDGVRGAKTASAVCLVQIHRHIWWSSGQNVLKTLYRPKDGPNRLRELRRGSLRPSLVEQNIPNVMVDPVWEAFSKSVHVWPCIGTCSPLCLSLVLYKSADSLSGAVWRL